MRFFKVANGKLEQVPCREGTHEVLLTIGELEELERRLKNKSEEAERWRKRATGNGTMWGITKRLFNSNHNYVWTLYLSVPLPCSSALFEEAQRISNHYFGSYMARGYTIQFTAGAGWILGLYLTAQEYNVFKTPDSI